MNAGLWVASSLELVSLWNQAEQTILNWMVLLDHSARTAVRRSASRANAQTIYRILARVRLELRGVLRAIV